MKTKDGLYKGFMVLAAILLVALAGACIQPLGDLEMPPAATGRLSVRITGSENSANGNARTMLASDPTFTRYVLHVIGAGIDETYQSTANLFQLDLDEGDYDATAEGYSGDKLTARTGTVSIHIDSGGSTAQTLTLKPYMEAATYGTLNYSLNWDGVGQIPAQAELLIEQYNINDDTWDPLPISLMNESLTAGSRHGSVLLVQRATGLVKQSGSLDLPPGEYRLTTTVTMDSPYPPVSRMDIAHIFSNLITPAAFFYGSGDLIVTNPGTDTGSGFITRFNFSDSSGPLNAASIIASNPSPDGTRLIMVTVPSGTDLGKLTPLVECAPGASVTSPPPNTFIGPNGPIWMWDEGDYSRPTTWVAKGLNGVTQEYTVVVNEAVNTDCAITDIAFSNTAEVSAPHIEQPIGTETGIITVTVPTDTIVIALKPVFSYVGTEVKWADSDDLTNQSKDKELPLLDPPGIIDFTDPQYFRVYAQSGATKLYQVTVQVALSGEAIITGFVINGYPDRPGIVTQPVGSATAGTITVTLPTTTILTNLTPLITYKGKTLSPASGAANDFTSQKTYTVTAWNETTTRAYDVTVTAEPTSTDTGIFDFVITNVPRAKVVIGTKPRADGKIPIVVQVPYRTAPLMDDLLKIDLTKLIPKITLSSPTTSNFIDPNDSNPSGASSLTSIDLLYPDGTDGHYIPFDNQGDYQEAVYRIRAEDTTVWQDYVVVVARDVPYYYVKATGNDTDADQYNGSESAPFKTLAYAVRKAVEHDVDHIYVVGTLNDTTEGGAWENTSTIEVGSGDFTGAFQSYGASATGGGASVFNLKGTGIDNGTANRIYITGVGSNAVLQGASNKRVISVTGGAHITFENITIRDGGSASYGGNGGGVYVEGNSTVIWKSGVISNNQAVSGGGLYVDNSEVDFQTGSISSNIATGKAIGVTADVISTIQGGGGVYVNGGKGQFWLAAGDISGNTTSGSGGGVLVNGSVIPNSPDYDDPSFYDFIMSAGTITGNVSNGSVWPGGGGGVYVAKGSFQMLSGRISENQSTRQGGGVFVWSRSLFYMDGNSSVVNNQGVGSSKAICSRGITTMRGSAQADKVYIWNYSKGTWNNGSGDEFTMMEGARITGLELAFADDPQDNRNYVNIVQSGDPPFFTGTGPITTIGLESRLTSNGSFDKNATIAGDWLGKYLIKNGSSSIPDVVSKRFLLDSYIYGGANPIRLTNYKLDTMGRLAL
jgi:hypothetical protein